MQVSGELLKVQQERIWLKCPGIQEPVGLSLANLHALIVSRTDAAESEPPAREGRLELAGLSLHGRLVDSREAELPRLVFQPRHSSLASPLGRGASGRLVYRDPPPPPKPSAQTEVRQAPAVRIVNGVRTLIGTRQPTTAARPAPPRRACCICARETR